MTSNHVVACEDFFESVNVLLREEHSVTFCAQGNSMWPLIHHGDVVTLQHCTRGFEEGDIVLARTMSLPRVVLHRVIKIEQNGDFVLQGDANCKQVERCRMEDIAGVAVSILRGNSVIDVASEKFVKRSRRWLALGVFRRVPLFLRRAHRKIFFRK